MSDSPEIEGVASDVVMSVFKEAFSQTALSFGHRMVAKRDADASDPCGTLILATMQLELEPPLAIGMALSESAASTLAKQFTGCAFSYDSDAMDDVVGEILNVVAGDMESRLREKGLWLSRTVPTSSREWVADSIQRTHRAEFTSSSGAVWLWLGTTIEPE